VEPDGNELAKRPQPYGGLAIPVPTAATYDTVTEGKTGWRFVLTGRWIAFIIGVLLYAAGGVAGVIWQVGLSEQISQFNATVSRNFNAPAVPLASVLPSLGSYTAAEEWKPVTATGTYLPSKQLYVRDRTCGSDTGFEVLTPLRMTNGRLFVVDRGCVRSSSANPNDPVATAAPPTGTTVITARVVASEAAKQSVTAAQSSKAAADQVDSIDLPNLAKKLDAPTYTGAYGMLVSQSPAPAKALHGVLSGRPSVDASVQQGTIFGLVLYGLVGVGIFIYALRTKFRLVNRFDPRQWAKEWRRIQRAARKPYTDAEVEDMLVAGVPLNRVPVMEAETRRAGTGDTDETDETDDAPTPIYGGDVIVGEPLDWETTHE